MVIDTKKMDMHLVTQAISCIMQGWLLPGMVGVVLFMLGFWMDIECVEISGLILAAPGWAYTAIIFVLPAPPLPHALARVVLAEQLYRAFSILHNHPITGNERSRGAR